MTTHTGRNKQLRLDRALLALAGIASLLATIITPVSAAATQYQFDVIVFESPWSRQQFLRDPQANAFLLEQAAQHPATDEKPVYPLTDPAVSFKPLAGGVLDDAYRKLRQSTHYRVLARKSWQQNRLPDGRAIRIELQQQAPTTGTTTDSPQLSGSLHFTFSRYIHLDADLTLHHTAPLENADSDSTIVTMPANAAITGDTKPVEATGISRIHLERKMRSNETHHIDHPLLGIVIHIKRLKAETPSADTTEKQAAGQP